MDGQNIGFEKYPYMYGQALSQAWKRSQITKQCVTFCEAAFMSKVHPCGWAVDAGQRQLGEVDFISSYHTLKNPHTHNLVICVNLFFCLLSYFNFIHLM